MDWVSFYGLAVFAALYPVVLAIVVLLLPHPRPAVLLAGMLTGGLLITVISGLVIVFVVGSTDVLSSNQHTVAPAVNITIGVILLVATVIILRGPGKLKLSGRRHKKAPQPPEKEKPPGWAARAAKADSYWGRPRDRSGRRLAQRLVPCCAQVRHRWQVRRCRQLATHSLLRPHRVYFHRAPSYLQPQMAEADTEHSSVRQ